MEFRIGARGKVQASGSLRRAAPGTVGAAQTITVMMPGF